jgi:hypothetical protein
MVKIIAITLLAAVPSFAVTIAVVGNPAHGSGVSVAFAGAPGTATDWLSVSRFDSPVESYVSWMYTSGATMDNTTLPLPVETGDYVARLYAQNSYTMLAESQPFHVEALPATIELSSLEVAHGSEIDARAVGADGARGDWVGLVPVGGGADAYVLWRYVGVDGGCALDTTSLVPGMYVLRLYERNGYVLMTESAPIRVRDAAASVQPTLTTFEEGLNVGVLVGGLSGAAQDWVGIYDVSSSQMVAWSYATASTLAFPNVPRGQYVARAHRRNNYDVVGESTVFQVAVTVVPHAPITIDQSWNRRQRRLTVRQTGMVLNGEDWVGLYRPGAPLEDALAYRIVDDTRMTFNNVPCGPLELRAYADDRLLSTTTVRTTSWSMGDFVQACRAAGFSDCNPHAIEALMSTYFPGILTDVCQ